MTKSFISSPLQNGGGHINFKEYGIGGNKVTLGAFEVDVIWLYILGFLIIVGTVIGIIICCCSADDKPAAKAEAEKEKPKDDKPKDPEEPKEPAGGE